MPDTCVFCDGGPLISEHILPRWLRKLLKFDRTLRVSQYLASVDPATREPAIREERRVNPLDLIARIVCDRCSGGWMENDQDVMKPLVMGEQTLLTIEDQHRVARWATKTAMTFEFNDSKTISYTSEDRHWLYKHRAPPPGTSVWIGYTEDVYWEQRAIHHGGLFGSEDAIVGDYAMSCAFGLGRLFLLVFASSLVRDGTLWPDFLMDWQGPNPAGVYKIFPPPDPWVPFPTQPAVNGHNAQLLAACSYRFLVRMGIA